MRVIETEIINALRQHQNFETSPIVNNYYGNNPDGRKQRRDSLRWSEYDTFLYELWGNAIVEGDMVEKILEISDCGYATVTTVSRLNAVFAALDIPMSCTVKHKKTVYFLRGNPVNENTILTGNPRSLFAADWKVKII